jgi:hypothetical protein
MEEHWAQGRALTTDDAVALVTRSLTDDSPPHT